MDINIKTKLKNVNSRLSLLSVISILAKSNFSPKGISICLDLISGFSLSVAAYPTSIKLATAAIGMNIALRPFIEASAVLNTEVPSLQDITLKVADSSGNEVVETFTFAVSDLEAPVINLLHGENVTVDYGSVFDLNNYVNVIDNLDGVLIPNVEGTVDTLKMDEVQSLKLSVQDSSGNITESKLNVVVKDLSAPVITLSESTITINAGDTVDFSSYLVSAVDNKDPDFHKISPG